MAGPETPHPRQPDQGNPRDGQARPPIRSQEEIGGSDAGGVVAVQYRHLVSCLGIYPYHRGTHFSWMLVGIDRQSET
jgi:hypothetical protein